jgi:hypothetical protein
MHVHRSAIGCVRCLVPAPNARVEGRTAVKGSSGAKRARRFKTASIVAALAGPVARLAAHPARQRGRRRGCPQRAVHRRHSLGIFAMGLSGADACIGTRNKLDAKCCHLPQHRHTHFDQNLGGDAGIGHPLPKCRRPRRLHQLGSEATERRAHRDTARGQGRQLLLRGMCSRKSAGTGSVRQTNQ